ncbi:MAG: hypothetical protein JWL85_816 [Candidatus Saccharibacteria bacterium]|nr:hypothetical protein [Candidatus Saccharibacteria bacterium]
MVTAEATEASVSRPNFYPRTKEPPLPRVVLSVYSQVISYNGDYANTSSRRRTQDC